MVVGSGGCQRILAALKRRAGILIGVEFFLAQSLGWCVFPSLGKRTLYMRISRAIKPTRRARSAGQQVDLALVAVQVQQLLSSSRL